VTKVPFRTLGVLGSFSSTGYHIVGVAVDPGSLSRRTMAMSPLFSKWRCVKLRVKAWLGCAMHGVPVNNGTSVVYYMPETTMCVSYQGAPISNITTPGTITEQAEAVRAICDRGDQRLILGVPRGELDKSKQSEWLLTGNTGEPTSDYSFTQGTLYVGIQFDDNSISYNGNLEVWADISGEIEFCEPRDTATAMSVDEWFARPRILHSAIAPRDTSDEKSTTDSVVQVDHELGPERGVAPTSAALREMLVSAFDVVEKRRPRGNQA